MSHFKHHIFFCTNQRKDGSACCQDHKADAMREYTKQRIKGLGKDGKGGVRVNSAGCLGRCEEGPVVVVYPDETWYTYVDQEDVEEIIEEHLLNGRPVERLKI